MAFVRRDRKNKIIGVFARPQPGEAEENLPDDDAEVVAFRAPPPPPTDDELIDRGRPDVLTKALLKKGVITRADLKAEM